MVAVGIHILLEIFIHILKHEHELVFGVDHIVQRDDILVLELLHKRDFADCGGGRAFFGVEVDLFESDIFAGLPVAAFEDLFTSLVAVQTWLAKSGPYSSVSAFAQLLQLLERVGVPLIHCRHRAAAAKAFDTDGRIGSARKRQSPNFCRAKLRVRRRPPGEARVPKNGRSSRWSCSTGW